MTSGSRATGIKTREETHGPFKDIRPRELADFGSLLTAPYTFMNQRLARYFGVQGPAGDAFARPDLDPVRYARLVTQPSNSSWLATPSRTHPILRGRFIGEKLLSGLV